MAGNKTRHIQVGQPTSPVRWWTILSWCAPLAAAGLLLLYRLSDVAGLHRDEAVFGLFAEWIQEGNWPMRAGFNVYTAPIHSYMIAGCFSIFGTSIWSLRISGVAFNLLALLAYGDVVRRIAPKRVAWLLWFVATLPMFVVFGRIAGENYALNPFFLFGGIWCYVVLASPHRSRWTRRAGVALTGLMFCLGVWNHVVFAPTAASVVAVYLLATRRSFGTTIRALPWFAMGGVLGAVPRLYGILFLGHEVIPTGEHLKTGLAPLWHATLNMIYTLGGNGLYARACGEIGVNLNWVLPMVVVASGSFFIQRRMTEPHRRLWKYVALCAAMSLAGTWLITPALTLGSRVWLLGLWFVPFLLCVSLPESNRALRLSIGAALIAINVTSVGINYFHKYLQTGGTARKMVNVGGRRDNSWDFVDTRPLAEKLKQFEDEYIYIEDDTPNRLRFLLPREWRDRVWTVDKALRHPGAIRPGSLVVAYRTPGPSSTALVAIKRQNLVLLARDLRLGLKNFRICRALEVRRTGDGAAGSGRGVRFGGGSGG